MSGMEYWRVSVDYQGSFPFFNQGTYQPDNGLQPDLSPIFMSWWIVPHDEYLRLLKEHCDVD